jgi:hypothetical protein
VSNGFFEADQNASGLSLETGDEQRPFGFLLNKALRAAGYLLG